MTNLVDRIAERVLFVSYGGGHAAMLAPVARHVQDRGLPVAILALTNAPIVYERFGLKTFGLAEIVAEIEGYGDAFAVGARLLTGEPRNSLVPQQESEAYTGIGYIDMVGMLGAETAAVRYRESGRQAFFQKPFFQQLFRQACPAVVVSTNSPRAERATLEAAAAAQIPSLCVVDLYARWEIEWCSQPRYADKICLLNETVAERFVARGVPVSVVEATGNPSFDRLASLDIETLRSRFRKRHAIGCNEKIVLFISQPEPEKHPFSGQKGDPSLPMRIEDALVAAFADEPGVLVVLRKHPSETRPHVAAGRHVLVSPPQEGLDEVLCAADCVVTSSSTVGLEAAILGIPVVQTMLSIFSDDLPLGEMGYAREVDALSELGAATRMALAGERKASIRSTGPAAPIIASMIEELADRR